MIRDSRNTGEKGKREGGGSRGRSIIHMYIHVYSHPHTSSLGQYERDTTSTEKPT